MSGVICAHSPRRDLVTRQCPRPLQSLYRGALVLGRDTAYSRGVICVGVFARSAVLVAVVLFACVLADAVSSASAPSIVTDPTWSPDGKDVAFAYTGTSTYRIVTAPSSGGGPIRTVFSGRYGDGCCDPILWSAAGQIVFDSNFTLTTVRPSDGKATRLASNISWFILSPNGATAAFDGPQGHSPSGIGLVNVTGGKPVSVPRPASVSDAVDGFSPDGTGVVFSRLPSSSSGPVQPTLLVEHVHGGAPVPLSKSALIGSAQVPADAVQPQWSPDGRWIAFLRLGKLEVVPTVGAGTPRVLAGWVVGGFSWAPNSKLLACFCGSNREHVRLTTATPQGTHRIVLWTNRSLHYRTLDSWDRPQWSPDGSKLVFLASVGRGNPSAQVWVVGANGSGLTRVA
jgi:Tol biopolymer transport system component